MKMKLAKWVFVAAALGIVSAKEPGTPVPGYLAGLRALHERRSPMNDAAVTRCSIDAVLSTGPHRGADMVVHANQVLIDYVSKNKDGVLFPIGSVLLKEKFTAGKTDAPAILTTRMERVAMDGTVKDWKFSATSFEDGKPTRTQEAPSSCVVCHEDYEETTFVSPDSVKLLREYAKKESRQ